MGKKTTVHDWTAAAAASDKLLRACKSLESRRADRLMSQNSKQAATCRKRVRPSDAPITRTPIAGDRLAVRQRRRQQVRNTSEDTGYATQQLIPTGPNRRWARQLMNAMLPGNFRHNNSRTLRRKLKATVARMQRQPYLRGPWFQIMESWKEMSSIESSEF